MNKPEPGWATPARVVDVHDGDTITVEVTRQFRVRILDCWAPEITGMSKTAGLKSRDALIAMISRLPVTVLIPTHVRGDDGIIRVQDILTLGRVLGRVWTHAGEDVAEKMVEAGYAKPAK